MPKSSAQKEKPIEELSYEEALAELREARRSLIAVLLECGAPIPEPGPVKTAVA